MMSISKQKLEFSYLGNFDTKETEQLNRISEGFLLTI